MNLPLGINHVLSWFDIKTMYVLGQVGGVPGWQALLSAVGFRLDVSGSNAGFPAAVFFPTSDTGDRLQQCSTTLQSLLGTPQLLTFHLCILNPFERNSYCSFRNYVFSWSVLILFKKQINFMITIVNHCWVIWSTFCTSSGLTPPALQALCKLVTASEAGERLIHKVLRIFP